MSIFINFHIISRPFNKIIVYTFFVSDSYLDLFWINLILYSL